MYRFNYLQRPVLITPDEVIFHAATDTNVDARQVINNIIVAEERFIAPAIGDSFYEELINLKNTVVTVANQAALLTTINTANGTSLTQTDVKVGSIINAIEFLAAKQNYVTLWNRFLWKLTAEAVDAVSIVPSWLRTNAQGQQMNNPDVIGGNGQGSASGNQKDIKFKLDKAMQDRLDPLIERMRFWIYKNRAGFPSYKIDGDCGWFNEYYHNEHKENDGISISRKTGIVFGAYDDTDNERFLKGRDRW